MLRQMYEGVVAKLRSLFEPRQPRGTHEDVTHERHPRYDPHDMEGLVAGSTQGVRSRSPSRGTRSPGSSIFPFELGAPTGNMADPVSIAPSFHDWVDNDGFNEEARDTFHWQEREEKSMEPNMHSEVEIRKQKLKELQDEIAHLKTQARASKTDAKDGFKKQVDSLEEEVRLLHAKLDLAGQKAESAFHESKEGLDRAWESIKKSFKNIGESIR